MVLLSLGAWLCLAGCAGSADDDKAEYGYVTAPTLALRDRVAAVYNKVAFLNNGDRVRILERSTNKRFVRVRSDAGQEGWVPQRYLATQEVYDSFAKLAQQHAGKTSQATAITRRVVNMHDTPARDGPTLYQLKEGERLELLQRTATPREKPKAAPAPKPEPSQVEEEKDKAKEGEDEDSPPPPAAKASPAAKGKATAAAGPAVPMEDWWLVRDSRKRAGWMLGRMLDVEIPLEVAVYAEGQRIVASYVLSEVPEKGGPADKLVPQYLVLMTENKDGLPYDFNQARVFTWNQKRQRYETAYRERLVGELPFRAGKEEGNPYFVLNVRDAEGKPTPRKYRMNGVMVRRVVEPGPTPAKGLSPAPTKAQPPPAKR
jgi:hypothetical protein